MKMKHSLFAGAALTAMVTAFSAPSLAQVEDEMIVTGSIIRGSSETSAVPIDVIGADELSKFGNPSPVDLIKSLPISSGVIGDSNQFDSRSQATEGMASVNLRGLSPQRTLVLLNNKRIVSGGTGVPFVDINLLPLSGIGRVEILKDGAAATYGSDAVGGVVNFITRTDLDGFAASADYKMVKGSDGDYTLGLSFGKQLDKVRVFATAGYQHRSELQNTDRDFAIQSFEANPQGGWTGAPNPGNYIGFGVGVFADAECEQFGGYITPNNRCRSQYTPFSNLVEKENRFQAYGEAEFEISDDTTFEVSALYGKMNLPAWRSSPSYPFAKSPTNSSLFFIPANHPGLLQYAIDNPTANLGAGVAIHPLLSRPFLAGGNPLFGDDAQLAKREGESFRVTADLSGSLSSNLDYNISGTLSEYDRFSGGNDSFVDRYDLALRGFGGANCDIVNGTAGVGDCKWFNPFSNALTGTGPANDPDVVAEFFVPTSTDAKTKLAVIEGTISGDTGLTLSGGNVLFGAGVQYRKYNFDVEYGDNNNIAVNPCTDTPVTGNTSCTARNGALAFLGTNANASLENDVFAGFVEMQLPVTDDFNVQLAARYEDYGGETGSTFDPKITARWQMNEQFAVRGSFGTTFRGPPPQQVANRNVTSLQLIGSTFRPVDVYGNPGLKPESATNFSAGLIYDTASLTASIDYFRYDITETITTEPLNGMLATMFGDAANCTDPAFADLRSRFLFADGNGVAGAGTCAISNIARVETNWINGGDYLLEGLDLIVNYRNEDVAGGSFGAGVTATIALSGEVGAETVEGIQVQNAFSSIGKMNYQTTAYPNPKLKGQVYLDYGREKWDGRLTANYIGGYDDQRAEAGTGPFAPEVNIVGTPTLLQGAEIDSQLTFDLNLRYQLQEATRLSVGVFNLTDEDPSFARTDLNYDPFTGSPIGRTFKFGISHDF